MTDTATAPRLRSPAIEVLRVNVIVGRAKAGFSQDDLARRSSVSRPTISRIERAAAENVGIDVVQRIADALGTTVAGLFIPVGPSQVDDDELERRASASDAEFVAGRALLDAIDEAEGRAIERYSKAGRPLMGR